MTRILVLALGAAALAGSVRAQSATAIAPPVPVTGTVPAFCAMGEVEGGAIFDLGVILETSSGRLAGDLATPPKTVSGLICNARSVIEVSATPMAAGSADAAPPAGFSAQVDYRARVFGWTETPASYLTGAPANPDAAQSRGSPHFGEISVALDSFATRGGDDLRPIADDGYRGEIVVTLSVAN